MNKPYTICHMMATIDGKITSGVGVDILDDYFNLYTKTEDDLKGDSWMCGRVTLGMFAKTDKTKLPEGKGNYDSDFISEKSEQGYMVTIDTKGRLRWVVNKIQLSNCPYELPILTIVTKQTPTSYLAYLQSKKINYIFGGDSIVDFEMVFAKLADDFGIKRLLVEGGGKLNGSVMQAGLIDEVSLMIVPEVLNRSQAPTMFDNLTDVVMPQKYSLHSVTQIERGCVWLRYKK